MTLSRPHSQQVLLERVEWSLNIGRRLTFTARDLDVVGSVGLLSSVRLFADSQLIFVGSIVSERITGSPGVRVKRFEAAGPLDLTRSIVVRDAGGVPQLRFEATSVGAILVELLERHGDEMVRIGAAGAGGFYDTDQIAALAEPVDLFWLENRDLGSVITELLALRPYALAVDLNDLHWSIVEPDQLDVFTVDLSSQDWSLVGYRIDRNLRNSYSAVTLVSDRQVNVEFAEAAEAWDSDLEDDWQMLHASYSWPDADQPDETAWVYRRFSYAGIDGLLEDQPVELVQKIKDASGSWTYLPIETLGLDRQGKYVVARYPVLNPPGGGKINIRNALVGGKAQAGTVYIRYRRYGDEPGSSARYPEVGHSGWIVDSGGLARELVRYCPDDRTVNADRARRLWSRLNRADHKLTLTLGTAGPTELFGGPHRVRLTNRSDPELIESETMIIEHLEYVFGTNELQMDLVRAM